MGILEREGWMSWRKEERESWWCERMGVGTLLWLSPYVSPAPSFSVVPGSGRGEDRGD